MSRDPQRAAKRPIFVVDDDASVRDSLGVLLETRGFDVTSWASGMQLLADDRRRHAGCVIIDHHMPGMDGLTTLAALRSDGCNAPAILITGRIGTEIAARAVEVGVMAVLEKPFPVARLLELARTAMRRAS